MRIAMVLQQKTLIQRCFGITFHAFFMEGMSNHNQYHFGVQNLKKKKKYIYIYIYIPIPRLNAPTLTTYSLNIYNIFILL